MKPVYLIHILQFTSILIWPKSANKHDTTTLRHDNVHVLRFQYWCNSLSQIINSVLKQDNFLPWLDFFKMSNICTKLETFYPADFSSQDRVELYFQQCWSHSYFLEQSKLVNNRSCWSGTVLDLQKPCLS